DILIVSPDPGAFPPLFRPTVPSTPEPTCRDGAETVAARFEVPRREPDTSFHNSIGFATICPVPGTATSCPREGAAPVPTAPEGPEGSRGAGTAPRRGSTGPMVLEPAVARQTAAVARDNRPPLLATRSRNSD